MRDGNIFISYRRGVDSNAAGRLYDRLERKFDRQRLFFDIDSIPLGVDFAEHIDGEVAKCDVLLVVIGPGWWDEIQRLGDPDDFVRIEIEAALTRPNIPVIPVLFEGATMPRRDDLPESLHPLVRRHAIVLSHEQFAPIVDGRLTDALRGALGEAKDQFLEKIESSDRTTEQLQPSDAETISVDPDEKSDTAAQKEIAGPDDGRWSENAVASVPKKGNVARSKKSKSTVPAIHREGVRSRPIFGGVALFWLAVAIAGVAYGGWFFLWESDTYSEPGEQAVPTRSDTLSETADEPSTSGTDKDGKSTESDKLVDSENFADVVKIGDGFLGYFGKIGAGSCANDAGAFEYDTLVRGLALEECLAQCLDRPDCEGITSFAPYDSMCYVHTTRIRGVVKLIAGIKAVCYEKR